MTHPTVSPKTRRIHVHACRAIVALAKRPDRFARFSDTKLGIVEQRALWLYGELVADRVFLPASIPAAKRQAALLRLVAALRYVIRHAKAEAARRALHDAALARALQQPAVTYDDLTARDCPAA